MPSAPFIEDGGNPAEQAPAIMQPRAYQQELLEESLRNNLIIALDTGSGKTHIAVLRMKLEAERDSTKVSWFLAPTVALAEQQREVIATAIPVSVGLISGASEPNQWKDRALWRGLLETHKIIVTTPQVLLDALHHGYVDMGMDITLMVFDEAHHAVDKHPYNLIMKLFYFSLPHRDRPTANGRARPMILGLTASPTYGTNVQASFRKLEGNMDCVIRSTRLNRDELTLHVHRPELKVVRYYASPYTEYNLPSSNHASLQSVVESMNIENDPYVKSLRQQLAKLPPGEERRRLDQKLSKTISKEDTFTHTGLRDFLRAATDIGIDLGPWAAEWYVEKVVQQAKEAANPYNNMMFSWQEKEKAYLLQHLLKIRIQPASPRLSDIMAGISPKVQALVQYLKMEEAAFRAQGEVYSGIIFVTRRDTVVALTELLSRFPDLTELFSLGSLLGTSSSFKRHAFLDITRKIVKDSQQDTLRDFRIGDKNLIVSTSVAEEGIDIQACGSVIRWDPPPNVVAWAQSRGRARRKRSCFALMFEEGGAQVLTLEKWMRAENEMIALYNDVRRNQIARYIDGEGDDDDDDDDEVIFETDAGALLTLHSATSHLNHFCAVFTGQGRHVPVYELDPPEFPEGWHSFENRNQAAQMGPWTATVVLPRGIPKHLRSFTTKEPHRTKRSARRHAAFEAYVKLYDAGLLNENLLPLLDDVRSDRDEVAQLLKEVEKREGTANVGLQMNPWVRKDDADVWFASEVHIDGLPTLRMFTRSELPVLPMDAFPFLYVPGQRPRKVGIRSNVNIRIDADVLERARQYTRHMFSILYSAHMTPDKTDFAYLFLPEVEGPDDAAWRERRQWMRKRFEGHQHVQLESASRANVDILAQQYSYPTDLALIRANDKFGKILRFDRWRHKRLTAEEEEEFVERYDGYPEMQITYPLLQVRPFHRRANFLIPLESETDALSYEEPFVIHPKFATVELVSTIDVQYAMLLPSVLHWMNNTLTVLSLRDNVFATSPVSSIPLQLFTTAVTAGVAQELTNYQRLETLGDTVLKFIVSMQIFTDFPIWQEGYLARKKDHTVSNSRLARNAIDKGMYQWIIRDRFVPRKWAPRYLTGSPSKEAVAEERAPTSQDVDAKEGKEDKEGMPIDTKDGAAPDSKEDEKMKKERKKQQKKKRKQELSTKVLADVIESLIGAAYVHGSFDLAVECAKTFGLGLEHWDTIPARVETVLARVEDENDPPPQLNLVERMLGYTFTHKSLLIQALTHGSYQGDLETISYERMEFLGDAVLDMIVTHYLYHAPGKNYKPGHIHLRKESLVNSHFLAYICMNTSTILEASMPVWNGTDGVTVSSEAKQIHLFQCMLHSSHRVLEDQTITFSRFNKNGAAIAHSLAHDAIYPYAALTSLQAPKFLSDIVESLLGAVFLDSHGDLEVVRGVLRTLGIIPIMERIVEHDVDVLHPVSRLAIWAAQQDPQKEVKYETEKVDGNVSCTVFMDGEEIIKVTEVYRSKATQDGVRFAAAEGAINILRVIEEEEEDDEDDEEVGWGDVPEYDW